MASTSVNVVSFTLKFNESDHPPPGWNRWSKEPIETALNRLGKTMIEDIPVVAVTAVHIKYNQSVMNDRDLITRLGFVLNAPVPDDRLYLKVAGPMGANPTKVYSNDIVTSDGNRAPILQNVEITILPSEGGKLDLELIVAKGTAKKNGSWYTVVTGYHFYKTTADDGAYIFEVELLKGFDDGVYVYRTAKEILEGRVNPQQITVADMDELLVDFMD